MFPALREAAPPEPPKATAARLWSLAREAWVRSGSFLPPLQELAQQRGWGADSQEPSIYCLIDPEGKRLFVPHPDSRSDSQAVRKWFSCSGKGGTLTLVEPASLDPTVSLDELGGKVIPQIIQKGRILFQ